MAKQIDRCIGEYRNVGRDKVLIIQRKKDLMKCLPLRSSAGQTCIKLIRAPPPMLST